MQELKFVVVGSRGTGKTVFMQRALDLKAMDQPSKSCKKMSLEGQVFSINLIETQLEAIDINEDIIHWPGAIGEERPLTVDGVLTLYDVTRRESISRVPTLLNACSKNAIPCVLIASKCDAPIDSRQIDPTEVEQLCMKATGIESVQISIKKPETHKRCVSVVLRSFIRDHPVGRSRTQMATESLISNSALHGKRSSDGRAISEVSRSTSIDESQNIGPSISPHSPTETGLLDSLNHTRSSSDLGAGSKGRDAEVSRNLKTIEDATSSEFTSNDLPGTPTTIANSFIKFSLETASVGDSEEGDYIPYHSTMAADIDTTSYTFEELVDRLLAPVMSKSDARFSATFLCLYRKFAAPSELLAAIWQRFERLQSLPGPPLLKISAQLRHLAILGQWLSEYPGDFAHPHLRSRMADFVNGLSSNRVFGVAASEMNAQLDLVAEDDDTRWACSDNGRERSDILASFSQIPSISNSVDATTTDRDPGSLDSDSLAQDRHERAAPYNGHSNAPSLASSLDQSLSGSAPIVSTPLTSVEAAQRQAESLNPTSRISLTKVQWHQFMDFNDEDIARELTRIDWIMYSSIRPRDLIRHVSLTSEQKARYKGLEYVNRMINQFNRVAFWVANMVLLRDKAKHRAKMLEKFMSVAWKLRQLNNYNAVGAIIAGVNGTAIHRLAQTRELVPSQVQKDFMRLEILMSTHKSNFAYRLAWNNTSSERIPFLPLHRRDLVSAEEGNRTYIGDKCSRINWRKFEIMGDLVVGMRESQGTPYPHIQRNVDIQKMIFDTILSQDEDGLYERSLSIEGPNGYESKKRFNWFQK